MNENCAVTLSKAALAKMNFIFPEEDEK